MGKWLFWIFWPVNEQSIAYRSHPASHLILCCLWANTAFYIFKWLKKSKAEVYFVNMKVTCNVNIRVHQLHWNTAALTLYLLSVGGFLLQGRVEWLRQRPRVAFPSLHTAAWHTTDLSAMVVTQQCFECHTHHWTTAFISFLLSVHACHVKRRRENGFWLSHFKTQ